jgi:DNA-binding transcriptional LysR family regulator
MSFSEAAYELNYSTSAISKQVASLEKSLNFKIFERSTKATVTLTKKGQKVMPYIQNAYTSLDVLMKSCYQIDNDSHLTISYVNARSGRYLKPLLLKYYSAFPEVDIELKVLHEEDMWKKLRQGDTDMVVRVLPGDVGDYEMPNNNYDTRGLMVIPISSYTFSIAMREGHPLSVKESVTIEDLLKYQILHIKFGDSFMGRVNYDAFAKLFAEKGIKPNIKAIVDDNDLLILDLVEGSDSVAPVLDSRAAAERKIVVKPLFGAEYNMTVCLLCLEDNLTPHVKQFIEFITGKKLKT